MILKKRRGRVMPPVVISVVIMLAGSILFASRGALGQSSKEKSVEASVSLEPANLTAGGQGRFKIKLHLMDGAHVNANVIVDPNLIPTTFTPKPAKGVTWGRPVYPEPSEVTEWYATDPLSVYLDGAVITVPFTIDKDPSASQLLLEGVLEAQACDHEQCYPPRKITLSTRVNLQDVTQVEISATKNVIAVKGQATSQAASGLSIGAHVPDFEFTDFDGRSRRFSEFRGRVVLIDFWATWCKPCLADIPHLKALDAKYRDKGLVIIGMDSETLGQDEEENDPEFARQRDERARQIVATRGANWTHATAATAVPIAVKVFAVEKLPTKILIDVQGKVIAKVEEGVELDAWLEKLLGGKQ